MKIGFLCILYATIVFSSMEIVLKVGCASFHPLQITFLRFLIGGIMLIPLAIKEMREADVVPKRKDWFFFASQGFLLVVVSMLLFQLAVIYGQASIMAVLFCCNPVFVVIFAYLILHNPITKYNIVSLLLSVAGILCIMNPAHMGNDSLGIFLMLLSAMAFAFYGVRGETRFIFGSITRSSFSFTLGSIELFFLILLTHLTPVANFLKSVGLGRYAYTPCVSGINDQNLLALFYVSICITGLGFAAYFMAMQLTSPAMASLVFFIKPALATTMAYFLIDDPVTSNMIYGIILLLLSSLVTFLPRILKRE